MGRGGGFFSSLPFVGGFPPLSPLSRFLRIQINLPSSAMLKDAQSRCFSIELG